MTLNEFEKPAPEEVKNTPLLNKKQACMFLCGIDYKTLIPWLKEYGIPYFQKGNVFRVRQGYLQPIKDLMEAC